MFFRSWIFLIFTFSVFLYAQNKELKVSFDPDYAPFSYIEKDKPEGLLIEYWKLWAEKNNYKIKFVNGKLWNNAIDLLKKGHVDFFLGTFSYQDWMKSSNPYYHTQTSLFIHKDSSKDLSKNGSYIIGIIGNDYKKYMEEQFPNSEIIIYENYKTVFKEFLSKKIDLIYDDKTAIEFYALRNDYFHIIRALDLFNDFFEIRAIAKDDKLIDLFNKGFANLSTNDLYEIENKWIINENQRFYKSKDIILSEDEKEFIKNYKVKIAASKVWKPFSFEIENKPTGISYEFWQLISQKSGLKSEYTFFRNFTSQLNSIKNRTHDIIYGINETKKRKKYALFSKNYFSFPLSITTLKDENFIEDISYILNKKIAVVKNFIAYEILKKKYPQLDFLLVENVEEGLSAVSEKEAYAFIDTKPTIEYYINKLRFDDLKITGNTGLDFNLSIMIRKDYPILKSILDKTISNLEPKEISTIITKWNNIHLKKAYDYKKIWLIFAIFIILIAIVLYKEYITSKENKKLENLVDGRTRELKELTRTLEQIVEDKTKELKKVNYILDEAQKIANLGSFQFNIKKKKLIFSDTLFKLLNLKNDIEPTFELALSFVHEDDKKKVSKILKKAIERRKNISMDFKILVDGKIKYIQSTSKITKFDEKNNPILFIGTILDLTKVKTLEKEKREKETILAQQAKMAAMGEMLENIAHQWRQPLSVISTASTGLQVKLELEQNIPKSTLLENITTVNQQAQYLSKTIEDFRNFFNPNKIKLEFNIKNSIKKTVLLIEQKLKNNHVQVIEDLGSINVSTLENELIQVLLNIFNNAIDAFNTEKNNYIFVKTRRNKDNLIIEIKDNAGGVDPKIINRIFEPYFTTKHKSQGTGIGLYMSNEIITKHLYGSINVINKSYTYDNISCFGACFTIEIPIKAEKEFT